MVNKLINLKKKFNVALYFVVGMTINYYQFARPRENSQKNLLQIKVIKK